MDYFPDLAPLEVVAPAPARCRFCLQSEESARLTRRNLAAFYTTFRPCGLGHLLTESEVCGWVCQYCWVRASQSIKFIVCALNSEQVLSSALAGSHYINIEDKIIYTYSKSPLCQTSIDPNPSQQNASPVSVKKEKAPNVEDYDDDLDTSEVKMVKVEPLKAKHEAVINSDAKPDAEGEEKKADKKALKKKALKKAVKKPKVKRKSKKMLELEKQLVEKYKKLDLVKLYYNREDQLQEIELRKKSAKYVNSEYKCELCGKAYRTQDAIRDHNKKCHDESIGPHECEVCHYRFLSPKKFTKHKTEHTRRWRCLRCHSIIPTHTRGSLHYERCSNTGTPSKCVQCDKIFTSEFKLKRHNKLIHGDCKSFACEQCGRQYRFRASLRDHIIQTHGGVKPYECELCGKQSVNLCTHEHHMRTHAPAERSEDTYCVECDKYFKNNYILRNHLRNSLKHVSKETFRHVCSMCSERFNELHKLKLHMRTIHLKVRTHHCQHCEKSYYTSGALTAHVKTHHMPDERTRDHICTICGKAFLKQTTLKQHEAAVHWKARPYACRVCPATFGYQGALYTHTKLKHRKPQSLAQQPPAQPPQPPPPQPPPPHPAASARFL